MKKILVILSFFLVLIAISTVGYSIVSANEEVAEIQEQIAYQEQKTAYLTPYGYTIDNPNIVLNPYGISPLTAIILFETEESEETTITIIGKDQNTTFSNTYDSTTQHIIPIYGLYPDTENQIEITCGKTKKTYTIKTEKIPTDINLPQTTTQSQKLTILKNDNYLYALDANNDIRWYLTKNTTYEPYYLENGHFLLALDPTILGSIPTSLIETDLTGKIYKQYYLEDGYYGSVIETENTYLVLSKNLIEIDKQTGYLLKQYNLDKTYHKIIHLNKETNTIILSNDSEQLSIHLTTEEQTIIATPIQINNTELTIPPYTESTSYKITKGIKFQNQTETPQSKENIFLVNYKEPDETYHNYHIKINQTSDNIQITYQLSETDEAYLILDKFLDKRVYDLKGTNTIINNYGLSGKYSLYIKINDIIYKTNTYINI